MVDNSFFNESTESSQVKSEIVAKYFWSWAKIITSGLKRYSNLEQPIYYVDLFCGPGRYEDGSLSTPIKVLERASQDNDISQRLLAIFNDKDENNSKSLQQTINNLNDLSRLKYKPLVFNIEVGEELVNKLNKLSISPALFFIDPWGYKGLSLDLIGSSIKKWGCDCIFFFNYNRINMGISNDAVNSHLDNLFGAQNAKQLRAKLQNLPPYERELEIVEALSNSLKTIGGEFVLPFRFKSKSRNSTSHHLIFVSKHSKGYEIMKEIMAKKSSEIQEGVASFEYNPATKNQPLLFEYSQTLHELGAMLLKDFAGQSLTVKEIYNKHNIGKPFTLTNYKTILKQLEFEGKINIDPPASERKKDTLANDKKVTFP